MSGFARLSDIETGNTVYIERVMGEGAFRQRIHEMGFIRGQRITVVKNAPLNDPVEFSLMGYHVSLRRNEAALVEVSAAGSGPLPEYQEAADELSTMQKETIVRHTIRVALVGNPNAGKTTLFNHASGSREHVGNYTGVTVDSKTAVFDHEGYRFVLTDLPGTYSLSVFSPEELYVRDFILEQQPDVVLNIVDASNLERNLYLTSQLIDMQVPVVVALNMYDELVKNKDSFNYTSLGSMLGIPFVPTVGSRGKGLYRMFRQVIQVHNGYSKIQRNVRINYGTEVEEGIDKLEKTLTEASGKNNIHRIPNRFIALRLLARDRHIESHIINLPTYKHILQLAREESERIEGLAGDNVESVITAARYGFIAGALKETYVPGVHETSRNSDRIDSLLTHRYLGFPMFLAFLWLMFSATYLLGGYPQQWIEQGITWLGDAFSRIMPDGSLKLLIAEGIIGGVGGVVVFLPNILILFLFISVMEDTGYMARAAFITDKLMHKIGLHGKSFIPLIMGFGCNVPAVMATRTIESRNNRLLTMLINPFMSCSARLPVYILLIGAVFPRHNGTLLFGLYLTGIAMAVCIALLFKKTLFRSSDAPFVMELPPYRFPTMRSTLKHMWSKASQYLRKMGGVIMVASVLIWALGHYPVKVQYSRDFEKEALLSNDEQTTREINALMHAEHQEKSYIGRIGKSIEPLIRPLGFDWKMGISLLTGIAAKEIVVSTMGVIYQAEEPGSLKQNIRSAKYTEGSLAGTTVFTPLATLSFLLFTLIYFPCVATIAAIFKESGSWKWAMFTVFYTTGLAWLISFVVFQAGSILF